MIWRFRIEQKLVMYESWQENKGTILVSELISEVVLLAFYNLGCTKNGSQLRCVRAKRSVSVTRWSQIKHDKVAFFQEWILPSSFFLSICLAFSLPLSVCLFLYLLSFALSLSLLLICGGEKRWLVWLGWGVRGGSVRREGGAFHMKFTTSSSGHAPLTQCSPLSACNLRIPLNC